MLMDAFVASRRFLYLRKGYPRKKTLREATSIRRRGPHGLPPSPEDTLTPARPAAWDRDPTSAHPLPPLEQAAHPARLLV